MIEGLFRKNLESFNAYETEKENFRIRLDANESFLGIPEELQEEIIEEVRASLLNRYPDPDSTEVCRAYGNYAGVSPERVMAGNGSDELIQITVNAFIEPGDRVMQLNPSFSMYSIYTRVAGGVPVLFELDEDFGFRAEELINRIKEERIKLLFLSNPNNPTGGIISREIIVRIIEECRCMVVIDEAYYEFYGESVIDLVERYENLIVLRTCSKALGIAGLRLGFLIAGEAAMGELKKVKPPYNVNSITQGIGARILSHTGAISQNVEKILEEKRYLIEGLRRVKGIRIYPSYTNFVLTSCDNCDELNKRILENGIRLRSFGSGRLENSLRITVGSRAENEELIRILTSIQGEILWPERQV